METLFIYLIKSSGLIGMFYLAYYFLLRKETFFTSNRWFLLAGLVTSVILPLIVFTKIVWVEPTPTNLGWSNIPISIPIEQNSFEINWYLVLGIAYAIGILGFLLKFAVDFYSLTKVLKGKTIQQQADFKFIDVAENVSPFSYFDYIVYNSSLYSQSELDNILEHEKVHSSQNHTIDVLISRLFCVVFWYNPFVWLYKKAILQNLEFIADSEASKKIADKKAYQITLLKITTHENCVAITNHFYQSLIKKRIVMLNKNQSKKRNSWKYALVLPVLAAFVIFFQVKVIAQEKLHPKQEITNAGNVVHVTVNKNSTEEEMKKDAEILKKEYGIVLKFSKIKRNSKGEITAIKVEYKDKDGSKGVSQIEGKEPIKPIQFYKNEDKIGFGSPREMRIFKQKKDSNTINEEDVEFSFNDDVVDIDVPEPPIPDAPDALSIPDGPDAPNVPKAPKMVKKVIIKNGGNEKPIIIINGKRVDGDLEDLSDLDPDFIGSVNVTRNKTGDDKDGDNVIEIITKDKKDFTILKTRRNKDEMKMVRIEMEKHRPEMEKAKKEMQRAKMEMQRNKPEMEQARKEMEQAKEEMIKAKLEMEKYKLELEQAKADLKKQK